MADRVIKVLLIEDNPGDVRLLQEYLREVASTQFNLMQVEQLDEALKSLAAESFDVVLLDLSLPDSHGLETFIKIHSQVPTVPVVVLTGLDDETLALKAMQEGAQDYLVKGQTNGELLVRSLRYAIERQRSEEALRQSESTLRSFYDSGTMMMGIVELVDNDILHISDNAATAKLFGVTSETMQQRRESEMGIPQEHIHLWIEHYRSAQSTQSPVRFEYTYDTPQGKKWLSTTVCPIALSAGRHPRFAYVAEDISDRISAEQKIREQAALLDVTIDAIFVQDLNNHIIFWNKGAERLYGWHSEAAYGQNAYELLYEEPALEVQPAQIALATEGKWQGELEQLTQNGSKIVVESRWTLVRDEEDKPKSILVVNTDITQKKKLEAQFLRAQRMDSLGTLAGGIAHDLNNVLAPILMAVQLLQLKFTDAQSQQLLDILENSAKRGAGLVKQVLSFARGCEGKRTTVQLKHLIKEIEQIVRETFPKSIESIADIAPNLWTVSGDVTHLHQVLMNLAVNARDAMPNGGNLSISAENLFIDRRYAQIHIDAKEGAYVVIAVADTGIGMPPEVQERMFEPFFTTKGIGQGTGLGLSTAIGIVKSHGGFITAFSEVGKGTTFKVYLPAVAGTEISAVLELKQFTGNGELILLVDDEVAICEITKSSLEHYNYQVLTARDGIEALALYAQHKQKIRLVLLDIMMPVMDGIVTMHSLQKMNPQVKIIAMSGLESKDKITANDDSVKAFLSKPCTTTELLQTIRLILNS